MEINQARQVRRSVFEAMAALAAEESVSEGVWAKVHPHFRNLLRLTMRVPEGLPPERATSQHHEEVRSLLERNAELSESLKKAHDAERIALSRTEDFQQRYLSEKERCAGFQSMVKSLEIRVAELQDEVDRLTPKEPPAELPLPRAQPVSEEKVIQSVVNRPQIRPLPQDAFEAPRPYSNGPRENPIWTEARERLRELMQKMDSNELCGALNARWDVIQAWASRELPLPRGHIQTIRDLWSVY